jgi:very-short-patch-repair endonuclease
MRLADFDRYARRHHGIITLEASGLTRSAWYRALRAGTIEQIHPYVARLHGTPDTPEQRIAAALAAVGERAVASHRSAAHLYGVPRPDTDPVDVIMLGRRRSVSLEGVIIHEPTDRRRLNPQRHEGLRCTNILRTLVDLGAVDAGAVHGAVGHALSTGLANLAAIQTTVIQHSRQGRSGVVALREAVADWSIDGKPADSVLEIVMSRLIRRYGLPPVTFHPIIEGYEPDFMVTGTPVLLECDGWTSHGLNKAQFERDRARDAELTAKGWIVVHFTYRQITMEPKATADRFRAAIDRWSSIGAPSSPDAA